ncbi:MAG: aminotransferase class V-fold PLP-dependent enzyme [Gammaproteobacteria bacterium]|nr:aminotransferase class V-fold PLP-dependent enzyme [Gammaproteobacteria bacterium]
MGKEGMEGNLLQGDYRRFWNEKLRPLFDVKGLDYTVKLTDGRDVRYVNLDHAATTMPFLEVKNFINEWFNSYGSVHRGEGQKSVSTTHQYDATRERICKFVGARADNYVIFTKNTTESINQAAALWARYPGKVLVSDIEHSSNLLPWVTKGTVVQYRTDQDGLVDLNEIEKILKARAQGPLEERIKLVTFTACSNITGYSPPIYDIARLAHRYGAQVFADLCQYIPHESVDMLPNDDEAHLDFIAFSGHKMFAPYGIGVLVGPKAFFDQQMPYHIGGGNLPYITRGLEIKRYFTERAHDAGTPNAMGPMALVKAMDVYDRIGLPSVVAYEHALVCYAYHKLNAIPGIRMHVPPDRIKHVIPYDLDGFDARLIAAVLSKEYGVGLRSGAFCTYEYVRKLKRITDADDRRIATEVDQGLTRNIPCIARASFSISNSFDDCDTFVDAMRDVAAKGVQHFQTRYVQDTQTGNWSLK